MKKFSILALSCAVLLASVLPVWAAVGFSVNGSDPRGTVTDFQFSDNEFTWDGSKLTFPLVLAGAGASGATSMASNETAVSTSYALVRKAIADDPAYSAGTLANGKPGQILTIFITEVAGSGTFVLTPTTKTGFSTLTFDAAKDMATLMYLDSTYGWILVSSTSVTVAIQF